MSPAMAIQDDTPNKPDATEPDDRKSILASISENNELNKKSHTRRKSRISYSSHKSRSNGSGQENSDPEASIKPDKPDHSIDIPKFLISKTGISSPIDDRPDDPDTIRLEPPSRDWSSRTNSGPSSRPSSGHDPLDDVREGMPNSNPSQSNLSTAHDSNKKRDSQPPNDDLDDQQATWLRRINIFTPNSDSSANAKWKDFKSAFKQFSKNRGKARDSWRGRVMGDIDLESEESTRQRAQWMVSTLLAGAPGALMAASLFLSDEDEPRVPLLLPLVGLKLIDTTENPNAKNRKFKIELEYGVGPDRLKWSVIKTSKDLNLFHSRLKLHTSSFRSYKQIKLPDFPKVDRYLSRHRYGANSQAAPSIYTNYPQSQNKNSNPNAQNPLNGTIPIPDIDELVNEADDHSITSAASSLRERIHSIGTRLSSLSPSESFHGHHRYVDLKSRFEDYTVSMENYLKHLCMALCLRPQCNRLFHFFALSPIGVLLSQENGFKGQQGELFVFTSAKAQGWRVGHWKVTEWKDMVSRHTTKWFLVRGSYVMYVSDINSTTPLEVFLVDSKFKISYRGDDDNDFFNNYNDDESDFDDNLSFLEPNFVKNDRKLNHFVRSGYSITLENSERKLRAVAASKREFQLWISSLTLMQQKTIWSRDHRFGSFAPVRSNCFAQWFVDGRDYFYAASSAMEMAKDVIYIHDWWLSPELYMRRPANGNQQWRLDRILKRKAEQGVKIFVIVYRNVGNTVATDSLYTKHSLIDLHENVHVIRSPNQLLQNTYFWAHHEKLLVVDQTIAFVGGIDFCFGRFDTPDHVLIDDKPLDFGGVAELERDKDSEGKFDYKEEHVKYQNFPGKDYSNPRVKDFHSLDKPYESMYNRAIVPRMPWHDIHMMTAGQVARDVSRHFVQRWNYLLRQKRPSRPTPLLLPPDDFREEELEHLGLNGTCEVQLLRSSCEWSLGLKEHEQSIQNAYLKLIETSEHFVYIENQFFITSCAFDGVVIKNRVGDALVDRIIRAHKEGKPWRACIVIPLMPGFEAQVDQAEGSSVRVIMQCQFMSISRGATSIFAKLRKLGIDPDDHIHFFSLRKWGRIGPDRNLVTEQLYIHAKIMIVDDRAAIIGSANINERSMRGVRDSEVAVVVRDKETVQTRMNGEPYVAGKFAHTMRMRLMREHLGINVDILEIVERRFKQLEDLAKRPEGLRATTGDFKDVSNIILSSMVELASRDVLQQPEGTERWKKYQESNKLNDEAFEIPMENDDDQPNNYEDSAPLPLPLSFNHRAGLENEGIRDNKPYSSDSRIQNNDSHKRDVDGYGQDKFQSKGFKKAALNGAKLLREWAQKAMVENPTEVFLPEFEAVKEILESDTIEGINTEDGDVEDFIAEKNRERWGLLKRVSYLQRVAAKVKIDEDDEAKRRVAAGLSAKRGFNPTNNLNRKPNTGTDLSGVTSTVDVFNSVSRKQSKEDSGSDNAVDTTKTTNGAPSGINNERKSLEPTQSNPSDRIPVVSLDEAGVKAVLEPITPGRFDDFKRFIDPYGFEDPLIEEFYEDVLFDNALRNTRIFRLIFHCQPDNAVTSWKEYKQFTRLQKAFTVAQDHESKDRAKRNKKERDTDSVDSIISDSQASVSLDEVEQDGMGLLGMVPPSDIDNIPSVKDKIAANYPKKSDKSLHGLRFNHHEAEQKDEVDLEVGDDNLEENKEDMSKYKSSDSKDSNNNSGSDNGNTGKGGVAMNGVYSMQSNGDFFSPITSNINVNNEQKFRRRKGTFSSRHRSLLHGEKIFDRETADRILSEIQGHLVMFPTDWLYKELEGNNWFYSADRIPPIEIYD